MARFPHRRFERPGSAFRESEVLRVCLGIRMVVAMRGLNRSLQKGREMLFSHVLFGKGTLDSSVSGFGPSHVGIGIARPALARCPPPSSDPPPRRRLSTTERKWCTRRTLTSPTQRCTGMVPKSLEGFQNGFSTPRPPSAPLCETDPVVTWEPVPSLPPYNQLSSLTPLSPTLLRVPRENPPPQP